MKTRLTTITLAIFAAMLSFTSCDKEDPTYTLTLTVNPTGAGVVTGAGEYTEGTAVTLTATPNEGYSFVNWTIGDTELSAEADFSYTTTAGNVDIWANFAPSHIVTLGAQNNTTTPGFLSMSGHDVYTIDQATTYQSAIDIFCFYEEGNDIAFGGPNSNISGIFGGGETDPVNWTTKNETRFYQLLDVTVEQFDALSDGDEAIQTYYNETEGRKKAKLLAADQIWSLKTRIGTDNEGYALVKIISVTDGATGGVTFEYKVK
ncbi:MAG: hypothetical protein RBT74_07360 [Tenuifilaceae bacterium]|jgi:hypothetical protein|nr:hypothetical protein [Tenuifilaceae bacterium]